MSGSPLPQAERSLEREVKLDVGVGFSAPDLTGVVEGVTVVARPLARLAATYYDTPDLRLLRRGMTLRHRRDRVAGGEDLWTLKLPSRTGHAALSRDEHSWAGDQDDVPAAARAAVLAVVRHAGLAPVADLVTTRRRVELMVDPGGRLVEVDDDLVSVVSGVRQGLRFREVEIELGDETGADAALEAVVAAFVQAGAARGTPYPKVQHALGLGALASFDVAPAGPASTMGDLARAVLVAGLDRILDHDHGIRTGDPDPEYVHQVRVATRRLRSDLLTLRGALDPGWVERRRSELRWLGEGLGKVRDLDVLGAGLRDRRLAAEPLDVEGHDELLGLLEADRQRAWSALVETLQSEPYLDLLDELAAAVGELPAPGADGAAPAIDPATPAAEVLPGLLGERWRKLRRSVRQATAQPTDDRLHRVRIRAKQLRYAAEAAEPVLGPRARRLAEAAAALQTELGELHDTVTAEAWLRRAPRRSSAEGAFVAGQLSAIEQARRNQLRATWHDAWRAARRQARRAEEATVLRPPGSPVPRPGEPGEPGWLAEP
ncbi:MAG TPA: CYTH and CHAD domain-containing protein [Acidimicrobiales bacterium]